MGYAEAIEQQVAAFHGYQTGGGERIMRQVYDLVQEPLGGIPDFARFRDGIISHLAAADPYFVARPIVDLAQHGAIGLPSIPFTPDLLPNPIGWMLLDGEVPYLRPDDPAGAGLRSLRAFLWGPLARKTRGDGRTASGILVGAFGVDLNPRAPCLTLAPMTSIDYDDDIARIGPHLWRTFVATLLFLRETILTLSSRPITNRQARRRIVKALGHNPLIRVVELRRRDYQQRDESQGEGVEYTCQWLVRGHWRQQFYPGSGEHRPRWIRPHVKGPSDKPLRVAEKVAYEVVR